MTICYLCRKPIELGLKTRDHWIDKADGGKYLIPAHRHCNALKSKIVDLYWPPFTQWMKKKIKSRNIRKTASKIRRFGKIYQSDYLIELATAMDIMNINQLIQFINKKEPGDKIHLYMSYRMHFYGS